MYVCGLYSYIEERESWSCEKPQKDTLAARCRSVCGQRRNRVEWSPCYFRSRYFESSSSELNRVISARVHLESVNLKKGGLKPKI